MQRIQDLSRRPIVLACLAIASLTGSSAATADCVDRNTCYGTDALFAVTDGNFNSAFGYQALYNNTEGFSNTAVGALALHTTTDGNFNTAIGTESLYLNTTGTENTAIGFQSLYSSDSARANTAAGYQALYSNISGRQNTAIGQGALFATTSGELNTANGALALLNNTTGYQNTASGLGALFNNTTGFYNTASGVEALLKNVTGNRNTAEGVDALYNAAGSRNVALGYNAGYNIANGADNIIIGAGQKAKTTDNGVIRIGNNTSQKRTFISAIRGVTTGLSNAVPVVVDANGQLGTINSSRGVKEDIQPMGEVSERLLELQPVTFRYKQPFEDGSKPVQFGLIAEEVAEVFPELAVKDANGNVETVSYHLLSSLLVNELQKEHRINESQAARIASLELQVAEIAELKNAMARMAQTVEQLNRERLLAAN